ncbi:MAG TPA: ABC transporter permease [Bryobacteraceae bacterium]|nr:ABC transporter permease [Bryobacteraceae bacterium]
MQLALESLRDIRYGLRSLRRSPGFAVAAILTLALGIGANTAIFSVLHGVVLSPLPYRQPDRLVVVTLFSRSLNYPIATSYPDFLDWQRSARSFEEMSAWVTRGFDLTSPGEPEHFAGKEISAGFFHTLGAKLAAGREFTAEEDRHGGTLSAIVSDRLASRRFSNSAAALGKTITLSGSDYTIVGVLPADFRFENEQADVYTPIGNGNPTVRTDRSIHSAVAVARLRPGITLAQAHAELDSIQEQIDRLYPAISRGLGAWTEPLKQYLVGEVSGTLLLLLGAVSLVLLIACANVANLTLVRGAARAREFALRLALGAGRSQVIRQLITESVLLSLLGGALGIAIARWGLIAVLAVAPASLPRAENIAVSGPVLWFALAVSAAVGIAFGFWPALKGSNTDLQSALKEGGRGSTPGRDRTQRILVVAQMALALVLLAGASLLFRTIQNLWAVNPGFDARNVITFQVGLSASAVETGPKTRAAYQQLMDRLRQIPGVEAADIACLVPLSQQDNSGPFWFGQRPASLAEAPRALYYWTGPEYIKTMRIPLLRGRYLAPADTLQSQPVVVIDSLMAAQYFGGRDPVGQTITVHQWGEARIVGVVQHVRHWTLDNGMPLFDKPQIYASFYQLLDKWVPAFRPDMRVALRTPLNDAAVLPAIKNAVYGVIDNEPVYNIRSMTELVAGSMSRQRLPMILLMTFAALALLLAAVGIYGVISYLMARRVHEIGIRMALGATKRDVFAMLLGQGLKLALAGVIIGALATAVLTRVVAGFSHLLFGVSAGDPLTFAAVSLCLIAASLLACYLPARRAADLDPMAALRHE